MLVSKIRPDSVFDGIVEFSDETKSIPAGYSFTLPPEIPEGYYAIMAGGWKLVQGEKPIYPPPPVPPAPPSPEEIQAMVVNATQKRLDDFALTRNYDNVNSISKYQNISDEEIASLPVEEQPLVTKFRSECRYLALATAQTWAKLYTMLAEVQAGTRPIPSKFEEIESQLPVLEWPV